MFNKTCKRGHLNPIRETDGHCRECRREDRPKYVAVAKERGILHRNTPCARGHNSLRNKDGHCKECRKEDKDKLYQSTKRSRNKTDRFKLKQQEWRKANRQHVVEMHRRWKANNPDHKLKFKEYVKRNSAYYAMHTRLRKAWKLQATPSWADKGKILELYEAAQAATEIFETPIHVDHMVPLRSKYVCGLHCEANLRLLPGLDNQRKSNRNWPDMPESLAA